MSLPALKPVLLDIVSYLEELRQILIAEYEALSNDDLDALLATAQTKHQLTDMLEQLEQERLTLLKHAGLDLQQTGLMAYFNQHAQTSGNDDLAQLWQRIRTATRDCERLNQINGIIIEKQKRRTESTLALLKGQPTQTELYSSQGESVSHRATTALGKA